jgi:hypothetical protein
MPSSYPVTKPKAQRRNNREDRTRSKPYGQGPIPTDEDPQSDGNVPAGAAPEAAPDENLLANNEVLHVSEDPATVLFRFSKNANRLGLLKRFLVVCAKINKKLDENPNLGAGPYEQQILDTIRGFSRQEAIEIFAVNPWMRELVDRLNVVCNTDQSKPNINLTNLKIEQLTHLMPDSPNALEVATSFVDMVNKNAKGENFSREVQNALDHCKMIIEILRPIERPNNASTEPAPGGMVSKEHPFSVPWKTIPKGALCGLTDEPTFKHIIHLKEPPREAAIEFLEVLHRYVPALQGDALRQEYPEIDDLFKRCCRVQSNKR